MLDIATLHALIDLIGACICLGIASLGLGAMTLCIFELIR